MTGVSSRSVRLVLTSFALSALSALSAVAFAQTPVGPVSLVVPYPAGGASDITARIVAPALAHALGTNVVVENVSGATGAIAIQKVINAPADGRMVYQGSQNELIIPPLTIRSVKFGPNDLEIIHPITTTRLVLAVRKDLPASDLKAFVALAREKSESAPLSYGSPGTGSLYHLISERMGKLAGVKFTHVPYKGAAPMMLDLIGNRIDFTVMAFSTTMMDAIRSGQYRIIANMTKDAPQALADIPNISSVEAFKDVDYASNAAYYVRKGTPVAIRQRLNEAIGEALSAGDVASKLEADGRLVHRGRSIADAEAFYRAEIARYQGIVAETGFKPLD